jgi:hypothetical protein
MHCLECAQDRSRREAVALCHACSAGLCLDHAVIVAKRLRHLAPINKIEDLPLEGRMVLCRTCQRALDQPHLPVSG